jgi:quercetin dioxygenase-like cupin family protein
LYLGLILVLAVSTLWSTQAQQPPAASAARFTGKVSTAPAEGVTTGRVIFEPAARSYWHSHPNGQLIMALEGRLRTQKQGELMQELGPAQPVYVGPNVLHWHGAAPGQQMTQLTIGFGGAAKWETEATEAQYSGKTR